MKRFWDKVQKGGQCWLWSAYKQRLGYGVIGVGGRTVLAHRMAWELTNGPIPIGSSVLHRCDTPSCVNPDHLFLAPAFAERFWTKVLKTDGCWIWTGAKVTGYGMLRVGNAGLLAHRLSWELHVGKIPDGLCVLHRCDNPPCVNPEHLFLGTHRDNIADRVAKGRSSGGRNGGHVQGERQWSAKLTDSAVRAIRAASADVSNARLARQYGVTRATARKARLRLLWRHL